MLNEQQKFLEELDIKPANVLDQPFNEPSESSDEGGAKSEEELAEELKNRHIRRMEKKLRDERESNIALNARLQGIAEAKGLTESTEESDYLKVVEKIYGTQTPEGIAATELLKTALQRLEESASTKAYDRLEQERGNESQAVAREEDKLDSMMESIEDEFNADFSNPTVKNGFLNLLEELSPKDEDGNIIEYADGAKVYQLYEASTKRSNVRAKEISGRSMTRGGSSGGSKLETSAAEQFLKENGII